MALINTANKIYAGASPVDKIYAGTNLVWSSAPTAPVSRMVTSYSPPGNRNDLDNYAVGHSFIAPITRTIDWLGLLCVSGNTGSHTITLMDHATQAVLRSASINLTGKTAGTWVWATIAPLTLTAGVRYTMEKAVNTSAGQLWADLGNTTLDPAMGRSIYGMYRTTGGAFNLVGENQQFVGLDIGTSAVTPPIFNTAVVWIDPWQDMARADGSTIPSYTSHSTGAKVLTAVATREPIFRANVGGKPRIAFTSDILQYTTYQPPVTGMTFVMVSRKIVIASYCELIAYKAHEMRIQGGQFCEGTMAPIYPRSTVSEATNVDYLHVVEFNNTTHACRVWINGTLRASLTGATEMVRTVGNLNFGGRDNLDLWGDITVSEAAVFDGALSDADRDTVTGHLMTKWGIT